MDIHKPKAAHSLREFLVEIGTIICGILIALGLEQILENIHARHETALLDKALKFEVTRDLGEALQQASMFYCVRSQAATAIDLLSRTGAWPGAKPFSRGLPEDQFGGAVFASMASPDALLIPKTRSMLAQSEHSPEAGAPDFIPSPRSLLMNRTWLNAASTPGLLHMDHQRRDRYALIYSAVEQIEAAINEGVSVRRHLTPLAFPQNLSASDRRQYIDLLSQLAGENREISIGTNSLVAMAEKNGIKPDPDDVTDRTKRLGRTWGGCMKPFVMTEWTRTWANKFENDRARFSGTE